MPDTLIIGAGGIGERHLRCFQKIDPGVVGIVESNSVRRELIADRYDCPAFATWTEARAAYPWKIAILATPAQTHIPIALELLEHKLHLLIEKPLSVTPDHIESLSDYNKTSIIRVAYVYRHMPLVAELKRRLDSGNLGRPLSAQIICGEDFSIARPDYAKIYYSRHETGGGAIQDSLTHFTNTMDWLLGPAEAVQCMSANRGLKDVVVEDTVCCSIRHAGGCLATYYVCQCQGPREVSFTIHCEKGTLRADLSTAKVGEYLRGAADWTSTQLGPFERDDFYLRQASGFLHAIEGKKEDSCTLPEAIHSLRVNLAALESSKSGQLVDLP